MLSLDLMLFILFVRFVCFLPYARREILPPNLGFNDRRAVSNNFYGVFRQKNHIAPGLFAGQ